MKLKFVIDKQYDIAATKAIFKGNNLKLQDLKNQYKTSLKQLKLTKRLYQESWDEINNKFSDYIEKITGYKWFYPTYECVISVIHPGISNWGTAPKIMRHWKENPLYMRRITAHELILSHYFEIYKKHFNKEGLTDGQVWALAEIAAFALTSLTPKVKDFWPWNTKYYTDHNYPHIVDLQNKLKIIFLKRENFNDYIEKGIKLVRKYPHMNPGGI